MPPGQDDPPHDTAERWPVARSERLWDGDVPFALRRDELSAPDRPGVVFARIVLEHPGAVVVMAVDDEERVLLLHQYRHAAGMRFVELPAGLLDDEGEEPLVAAQRELREEGALHASSWAHLLTTYSSPGISDERVAIFLARDLSAVPDRGGFALEHEEADMTTSWVPVEELLAAVLEGRVQDAPVALAVMAYQLGRGARSTGRQARLG